MDPSFDVGLIATATHGFSCSDLKELCRNAVMVPVREAIKIKDIKDTNIKTLKVRAVTGMDFLAFIETDIALGQTPTLD